MTVVFDPSQGVIHVPTRLWGPAGVKIALLALDTGAQATIVKPEIISMLGFDLTSVSERVELTSVSGVDSAPKVTVARIEALNRAWSNFPITCYSVQLKGGVDGVLGFNFFLRRKLTIDFRIGLVSLE